MPHWNGQILEYTKFCPPTINLMREKAKWAWDRFGTALAPQSLKEQIIKTFKLYGSAVN